MAQSATLLPSGVMKLESKESIQEIKHLKNNLTQAEARVLTQVTLLLIFFSRIKLSTKTLNSDDRNCQFNVSTGGKIRASNRVRISN